MISCKFENGKVVELRHAVCDVIVRNGNGQVLMGRRAENLVEGGKWALPGGYVDRGEQIPDAARRELMEETGWTCSDLELFTIRQRPDRTGDDRQNISFVFLATADSIEGESDAEVTELAWFDDSELPQDVAFDHADLVEVSRLFLKDGKKPKMLS